MHSDGTYLKGLLLLNQSRFDLAEAELRRLVIENPEDPEAHRLLAAALSGAEKYTSALHEAREAARLAPDDPDTSFTLGEVHYHLDQYREAEAAVRAAMELDPHQPHHYGLLAAIRAQQGKWAECLRAADEGLSLDPEHGLCTSFRTMALTRLGRNDEAKAALEGALARDPENEISHCHQGWALLHEGKAGPALEHFREALRIDPRYEYARAGLIEAMKARNPVYAQILRALLWASRWPTSVQWGLAIGYFVVMRTLDNATRGNPVMTAVLAVLRVLVAVLWIVSVTADPLFTLALRFSPDGRRLLDDDQRAASNIHAVLLLGVVVSFATAALPWPFTIANATLSALVCGFMIAPVAYVYRTPEGAARRWMAAYAVVLGVVGFTAVWTPELVVVGVLRWGLFLPKFVLLTIIRTSTYVSIAFLVGVLCSGWVSQKLTARQRERDEAAAFGRS